MEKYGAFEAKLSVLSAHKIHSEDPDRALELLLSYREGVFKRCFPNSDERETFEDSSMYFTSESSKGDIHFLVKDQSIIGGLHYVVYEVEDFRFGTLFYLCIDPEQQSRKYGRLMCDVAFEEMKRKGCRCVVLDTNDPYSMTEEELREDTQIGSDGNIRTPSDRRAMWKHLGFSVFDAPYFPPALGENAKPLDYLMLGVKVIDSYRIRDEISLSLYLAMTKLVLMNYTNGACWESRFDKMKEIMTGVSAVRIIPLDQKRSFLQ